MLERGKLVARARIPRWTITLRRASVGAWLRQGKHLRHELAVFAASMQIGSTAFEQPAAPLPDGLHPPTLLRYGRKSTNLEPIPWNLLRVLWPNLTRRETEVLEKVWSTRDVSTDAIKAAVRKANEALAEVESPLRVARKAGYIVLGSDV